MWKISTTFKAVMVLMMALNTNVSAADDEKKYDELGFCAGFYWHAILRGMTRADLQHAEKAFIKASKDYADNYRKAQMASSSCAAHVNKNLSGASIEDRNAEFDRCIKDSSPDKLQLAYNIGYSEAAAKVFEYPKESLSTVVGAACYPVK